MALHQFFPQGEDVSLTCLDPMFPATRRDLEFEVHGRSVIMQVQSRTSPFLYAISFEDNNIVVSARLPWM
jgi:hypothetical protein